MKTFTLSTNNCAAIVFLTLALTTNIQACGAHSTAHHQQDKPPASAQCATIEYRGQCKDGGKNVYLVNRKQNDEISLTVRKSFIENNRVYARDDTYSLLTGAELFLRCDNAEAQKLNFDILDCRTMTDKSGAVDKTI